jgi:hypothetical protein
MINRRRVGLDAPVWLVGPVNVCPVYVGHVGRSTVTIWSVHRAFKRRPLVVPIQDLRPKMRHSLSFASGGSMRHDPFRDATPAALLQCDRLTAFGTMKLLRAEHGLWAALLTSSPCWPATTSTSGTDGGEFFHD